MGHVTKHKFSQTGSMGIPMSSVVSPVTRFESNPALMGCGRTGDSQLEWAAYSSAAIM